VPTATILYDADCPFCRWSADKLLAWDQRRRLRPVPIQSEEADRLLPGMDHETKMRSWHFVTEGGTVYSAGAAFPPMLRLLPGGRPLAALTAASPGLTEAMYRWVTKHRDLLVRLLRLRAPLAPSHGPSRLRERGEAAFASFVRHRTDDQLDRTLGTTIGLRGIFKGMERTFVPEKSDGVRADIQYELRVHGELKRWVVRIADRTITTGPGVSPKPALTLRMDLPVFARIIAGQIDAPQAFADGKIQLEGDVELAVKMAEMFGYGGAA
jgi:predicted DCC family thiol-disulfide oxidoreductase YuxK/putative sterol carrier protein